MDDLISRRAVLDALDEQIEQCNKSLSSFDISMKDEYAVKVERASLVAFREILEYLSPAQLGTNLAEVGTDCISRQAAIDAVLKCYDNDEMFEVYERELKELPSAEPEPKRGKWLDANICGELPVIVCNQCKTFYPLSFGEFHNFCPNCGADMRGE